MKTMVTGCPAERALQVVGGRWRIFILHQLFGGIMRFSDLQRGINAETIEGITPKVLTQELRQMESNGLISRKVYAQAPPRVEYSLTPLGMSLRPVADALIIWGRQHQQAAAGADETRKPG